MTTAPNDASDSSLLAYWNFIALGLAVVAAAGSVFLSVGLGLKACPLCFYQRTFAIAAALVLAMTLWLDGARSRRAAVVTLSLAASGLVVAAFHVYLVQTGKLECPLAFFGWGDGPLQSLVVFAALTLACLVGALSNRRVPGDRTIASTAGSLLLGLGAAVVCIASAPPLPPAPKEPYDAVKQPFDMCRPPFPVE